MESVKLTKPILKVLRPALHGAKGTIKREILQGISKLYKHKDLWIVTRKEQSEFVIVAVAGRGLLYAVPHLIRLAEQHNCTSIRWHTRNPNAIKHGFKHLPAELIEVRKGLFHNDEYVYRLVLNGR